jgi:hypothetical protein
LQFKLFLTDKDHGTASRTSGIQEKTSLETRDCVFDDSLNAAGGIVDRRYFF